ncbi:unnamed protein product [Choristocarpus tenellus]
MSVPPPSRLPLAEGEGLTDRTEERKRVSVPEVQVGESDLAQTSGVLVTGGPVRSPVTFEYMLKNGTTIGSKPETAWTGTAGALAMGKAISRGRSRGEKLGLGLGLGLGGQKGKSDGSAQPIGSTFSSKAMEKGGTRKKSGAKGGTNGNKGGTSDNSDFTVGTGGAGAASGWGGGTPPRRGGVWEPSRKKMFAAPQADDSESRANLDEHLWGVGKGERVGGSSSVWQGQGSTLRTGRKPEKGGPKFGPKLRLDSGAWDGEAVRAGLTSEAGKNHLVVLVHGLGGKAQDMSLMRGFLEILMPAAEVMVATSLEVDPNTQRKQNLGIEGLGKKLAEEVQAHILRFCPGIAAHATTSLPKVMNPPLSPMTPIDGIQGHFRGGEGEGAGPGGPLRRGWSSSTGGRPTSGRKVKGEGRLSFICFSLGGLVTRSALMEMALAPYLSHLHCFVSLACPHLGQASTPLSFFKTGAWALRKMTGLRVLHELDMEDAEDPRETILYRLCFSPGMEMFRTIVLASNPRDGFVPLHSGTATVPPGVDASSRTGLAAAEMAAMLMTKVDEQRNRVVRVAVDFRHQSKGALDSVIGRAGHLCFIESPQVTWLMTMTILPFMEEGVGSEGLG